MGTPRGGSREGGFAPRRCEPPATQHGSGEKPPRRGRPHAAFPRRRLLALKKPRGAKILRVEAVGGNGRAAAGSGREAFWETRGGGGRRGGENPISSTISTESVGRVPGMEGGRREAPPGLPGEHPRDAPCKAPHPVGPDRADPGQVWRRARPNGGASAASSSGCAGCWTRRSAGCCGAWPSSTLPSRPPRRKKPRGWPRRSRGSTASSGSWRPGACPSWNEARLQLPPELEKSLRSCRRQHAALEEALKELRDPGRSKPRPGTGKTLSTEEKAKGTPDPGSAPPQVLADRKSVRWDEEQAKGREPRRCEEEEEAPGALGCEGAAPRRCSWEVEEKARIGGL
ncbi:uncharacterized protein [Anser cygnoides]|uniref:uncharacterized protein isoform X5 n=1 Tax=Anser cygnoides TaxID=8845 RepID=UPI0034D1FFA7